MFSAIYSAVQRALAKVEHAADHGAEDLRDAQDDLGIVVGGWASPLTGNVEVITVPSERHCMLAEGHPWGVCWHWTATRWGTAETCAKRIRKLPKKDERAASFHGVIPAQGKTRFIQTISFNRGSWNCGGATARRFAVDHSVRPAVLRPGQGTNSGNVYLIGLELENVGEVRKHPHDGNWYGWPFTKKVEVTTVNGVTVMSLPDGPQVPEDQVTDFEGKHYHRITLQQVEVATAVLRALVKTYGIPRAHAGWTHAQIDPTRKTDPGPIFTKVCLPQIIALAYADTEEG